MDVVTKLQHRSSSPPRDFIFSRIPFSPRKGENSYTKLWIFFSAAVSIAVFLYLLLASKRINSPRFSIIIDAGSTGTRLHVFSFVISPKTKLPVLDLASTSSLKVRPGLSSYSGDPSSAGDSLVDLLRFGKGKVPRDQWGDTEVRLMATAGLRMLDAGVTDSILESCRMALRSSGFLFQDEWATVISGSEEGVFAWVAANYALGMLGGDPLKTNGIIELGGASAQITFATEEALPSELAHVVKFGEATYKLYSNSFLHFGQNVAQESVKELLSSRSAEKSPTSRVFIDPCSPRGYSYSVMSPEASTALPISTVEDHSISHASGNFSECKSAALLLLKQENGKCLRQECRFGSNYIPKLQGRFLATENFFFTSEFFGLGSVQCSPILSLLVSISVKKIGII
ncbi:hypothetical protein HPP92_016496 [Vanilla planifolia]|uniref:Apyrase 6 n=1 Tax=Vanilla planifolia TaxID=51239 RepID=A0A835US66_VANPL|nr:hypothetical protein HPP92_016496 [Vanilla planifolia]